MWLRRCSCWRSCRRPPPGLATTATAACPLMQRRCLRPILRTWFASQTTAPRTRPASDVGATDAKMAAAFSGCGLGEPHHQLPAHYEAVVRLPVTETLLATALSPESRSRTPSETALYQGHRAISTERSFSRTTSSTVSAPHDTKNRPQQGVHARWESDMLNGANINGITTLAATYYGTAGARPLKQHLTSSWWATAWSTSRPGRLAANGRFRPLGYQRAHRRAGAMASP